MAEMTTLLAAIYRRYTTIGYDRQKGISPGITSRFEVFYDESFPKFVVSANKFSTFLQISGTHMCEFMQEHECWVNFTKREKK
jgi:uncharacterized protein YozE (UPF0346 family)